MEWGGRNRMENDMQILTFCNLIDIFRDLAILPA